MSNVWVYIEHFNGKLSNSGKEALAAGRSIADALSKPLTGILLGHHIAELEAASFAHGVDELLMADNELFAQFRVDAAAPTVVALAKEHNPAVILASGTVDSRDLTSWVAAELDAGLLSDAVELTVEDGKIKVTRPVYAGKLMSTIFVTEGLQLVNIRNRAFSPAEATDKSGSGTAITLTLSEEQIPTKIVNLESKSEGISLTDAKIIVSGGRGVGGPEGFAPIQELATILGGAMGASRATVDAGWIPYEHQVGQTGKVVAPELYIALGISGAIQHQAGMRNSKVIVAINKDGDAPIFKLAHYGIVGDLFTIAPALTAEFKKRLDK